MDNVQRFGIKVRPCVTKLVISCERDVTYWPTALGEKVLSQNEAHVPESEAPAHEYDRQAYAQVVERRTAMSARQLQVERHAAELAGERLTLADLS